MPKQKIESLDAALLADYAERTRMTGDVRKLTHTAKRLVELAEQQHQQAQNAKDLEELEAASARLSARVDLAEREAAVAAAPNAVIASIQRSVL